MSDPFGKTVAEHQIGPLAYSVKKKGNRFTLWLNGCRIGRPRADKPESEIWEYSAAKLTAARAEMLVDARERLLVRIKDAEQTLKWLRRVVLEET